MKAQPTPAAEQVGALLGPRLAGLVVDALTEHSARTVGHKAQVITSGLEGLLDLVGAELQPFMQQVLRDAGNHPDLPEHAANLLHFAADHHGEAASLLRASVGLTGVGSGIGTVMSAAIAPSVQYLLAGLRTALPDPGTLAQGVTRGFLPHDEARHDAAKQNLDPRWSDLLNNLAYSQPDVGSIMQLLNRGLIDESYAQLLMQRNGFDDDAISQLLQLRHIPLSPADLADMVVRGIKDHDEAARTAERSGVDADDFAALVLETGAPLALEQLLLLFRRGQIDQQKLEHGIRQSRIRNEWIPYAVDLKFGPPSGADAIRAAVQGQLPDAEARRKLAESGINPAEYDWMFNTAGRPPGVQEMIGLWRKGYVGKEAVAQAVRESDIKTKYVPDILKLFEYRPPPRGVVTLLHNGAISDAKAAELLTQEGMPPDLVAVEIKSAHRTRTATARHLAASTVTKLYHERAVDHATALAMLEGLGHDTRDATFILTVEDLHREAAAIDHATNHVRSLYIAYHLDRGQAVAAIIALGIETGQADHLFSLWDLERTAAAKKLAHGTITSAVKKNIIDQPTAQALLEQQGYSPFDAWVLISVAVGGPSGTPPGGP